MHNDIAAIQQHPVAIRQSLGTDLNALGLKLFRQMIGNRRDMPVRAAAGHDHMVGYKGFSCEINGLGVNCLVVVEGLEDQSQDLAIAGVRLGRRAGARYLKASGGYANMGNI